MSRPKKKQLRHSIDFTENSSILATIRPATPLFHRTLRRSVQDSRTFQAVIPLGMGRIHYTANHLSELKSMIASLSTPLRIRRGSQSIQDNSFRPPSKLRRRLVAKSPFPLRLEGKNMSPPETPSRKTPTPALQNMRLQRGVIEEYEGEYLNGNYHGEGKALYTNGDTYEGQWVEGRKQGTGSYFYCYFNAKYKGDWFNDEKNGFGVMKFTNGDEIQGFWHHGLVSGDNALMEFANGCSYTGAVVQGVRTGKGKMRYFEGVDYFGTFLNDSRDGRGLMIHDNWIFEGDFRADSAEGQGILVYKTQEEALKVPLVLNNPKNFHPLLDFLTSLSGFTEFSKRTFFVGDVFIFTTGGNSGSFISGKLNGNGVAIYGKFAVYVGCFLDGKRNGHGKMIYTDRDAVLEFLGETEGEYVGQWKADQRHGNGVMIWPNGIIYDGRWANNKRHHVTGKLIYPNGNVYEGGWVEEKMQGVGTLTTPFSLKFTSRYISGNPEQSGILEYDGHTYEGECVDMKPHGRGKLRLKSGDVYEGDMKYGNMTGLGKILYLNGGWYTGEVYNGTRSGKGKMVYTNGSVYEGFWDKDMRDGLGSFTDKHGVILYAGEWKEDRQEGKAVVKGKPRTRTRLVMKV